MIFAAGIEHPALRFRKTPGERIRHPAELLPEGHLLDHREFQAAVHRGGVEAREAEFDGPIAVPLHDFGRKPAVVEFGLHLVRLQVLVGEIPADSLPFPRAIAELDFHYLPPSLKCFGKTLFR